MALALIEKGAKVNAANKLGITPLHYAIRNDNLATALAIIHYGKVPVANIPAIEENQTSKYIQRQYQLANNFRIANHARGFFSGMNASYRDTLMVKIKICRMITGEQLYLKIMTLLHNKHEENQKAPSSLPTELLRMVLQYAGLLPSNLDLDLGALGVKKTPATDLAAKAMHPTYAFPRPTRHAISSVTTTRRR